MTHPTFLGIDISKAWFDVCLLVSVRPQYARFDNDAAGLARLDDWLTQHLPETSPELHACLEATGRYGESVAAWFHNQGHRVSVVNPALVKYHAASMGVRHKSERGDALVIAEFCQQRHPALWHPPTAARQTLRAMTRQRDALERMHNQEHNRLQAGTLPAAVQTAIEQHLHFIEQQIASFDEQIQVHIEAHPNLHQQQQLITTIQGIGTLTAAKLLGEMPSLAHLKSARSLAAFAGLNPRREQSGTGRVYTRLSKMGNAQLRKALYFPALSAMQHNPLLKPFAERLKQRGLAPQQVVAAVMRKLLHYVYGVLKHQQPFDPSYLQR